MSDRQKAMDMRHAIDQVELAFQGLGDFPELPRIFDGADDVLIVAPKLKLGDVRQLCKTMAECTRIINSPEYDKFAAARKSKGRKQAS